MKRRKLNPAKFERCVKKVKRSLKKTRRPGNAYAICKATRANPVKWNPILPLDIWTATMTPNILGGIEKQREKIARSFGQKKRKNLFGKKKVTLHLKRSKSGKFIRRKNKGRADSVPASQDFYQGFHGEPSKELVKVKTDLFYHSATGGIGELRKLKVKSENGKWKVTINFSKPYPILSAAENRRQLFIDGGDQSVSLRDFGIDREHEREVLGKVTDVYYFTTKKHLRPEDGGTAVFHHKFGGKDPVTGKKSLLPVLIYDVPNQLLEFAGGGYTIPDEGIDG